MIKSLVWLPLNISSHFLYLKTVSALQRNRQTIPNACTIICKNISLIELLNRIKSVGISWILSAALFFSLLIVEHQSKRRMDALKITDGITKWIREENSIHQYTHNSLFIYFNLKEWRWRENWWWAEKNRNSFFFPIFLWYFCDWRWLQHSTVPEWKIKKYRVSILNGRRKSRCFNVKPVLEGNEINLKQQNFTNIMNCQRSLFHLSITDFLFEADKNSCSQ